MATQIPYPNLTSAAGPGLTGALSSNFQATQTALSEKLTAHRVSISGYAATGATTTQMALASTSPTGSTPWAVLLVRCRETRNPGGDLSVSTRLNFTQAAGTLYVYEPAGLTLNTQYDMDFLVLE